MAFPRGKSAARADPFASAKGAWQSLALLSRGPGSGSCHLMECGSIIKTQLTLLMF